jgi:hypothetical protein
MYPRNFAPFFSGLDYLSNTILHHCNGHNYVFPIRCSSSSPGSSLCQCTPPHPSKLSNPLARKLLLHWKGRTPIRAACKRRLRPTHPSHYRRPFPIGLGATLRRDRIPSNSGLPTAVWSLTWHYLRTTLHRYVHFSLLTSIWFTLVSPLSLSICFSLAHSEMYSRCKQ